MVEPRRPFEEPGAQRNACDSRFHELVALTVQCCICKFIFSASTTGNRAGTRPHVRGSAGKNGFDPRIRPPTQFPLAEDPCQREAPCCAPPVAESHIRADCCLWTA